MNRNGYGIMSATLQRLKLHIKCDCTLQITRRLGSAPQELFWQAFVMEEVYQAQPSRRPSYETGTPNTVPVASTSPASSGSVPD
jgi:hypothetical protein